VTLKYRENDFQVRRASERGPPRDAAAARLSRRKDVARTIDNSRPPCDVLFLFLLLSFFLFLSLSLSLFLLTNPSLTSFLSYLLMSKNGYLILLLFYALNLI